MHAYFISASQYGTHDPYWESRIRPLLSIRHALELAQDDPANFIFFDFLETRNILHHYEWRVFHPRGGVPDLSGRPFMLNIVEVILIHVYSDYDAFEIRLHTGDLPLKAGWEKRASASNFLEFA